eukprot:gene3823-4174_t
MATGSGKSLIFQLPVVTLCNLGLKCCAIVISPLIALMEDQVSSLIAMGIPAIALGSLTDHKIEERAMQGDYWLIYCTPEKAMLWKHGFQTLAQKVQIICLAIDESHCVSEWGNDFRPEYRQLKEIRSFISYHIPIIALTASATLTVQQDIINTLELHQPFIIRASLNRSNLKYNVRIKSTTNDLLRVLLDFRRQQVQEVGMTLEQGKGRLRYLTTLIYVNSRKACETIAQEIVSSNYLQGIQVAYYHAGLTLEDRTAILTAFLRDEIEVVVATTAFGMGINKADIRLVIHYGLTLSVEAYYQQTGRAGRDGASANCVLLSSDSIGNKIDGPNIQKRIQAMVDYAQGEMGCRRRYLLRYFEEMMITTKEDSNDDITILESCCDLCDQRLHRMTNNTSTIEQKLSSNSNSLNSGLLGDDKLTDLDLSYEVYMLLATIQDCGGHYGLAVPISVLLGRHDKGVQRVPRYSELDHFGKGSHHQVDWWKALAIQLTEVEKLLDCLLVRPVNSGYSYQRYTVSMKGLAYLKGVDGQQHGGGRSSRPEVTLESLFGCDNMSTNPFLSPAIQSLPPRSLWDCAESPFTAFSSSIPTPNKQALTGTSQQGKMHLNRQRLIFDSSIHHIELQLRRDFIKIHLAEEKVKQGRGLQNDAAAQKSKELYYSKLDAEVQSLNQQQQQQQSTSNEQVIHRRFLEDQIRRLRNELATKKHMNPYQILSPQEIQLIVIQQPNQAEELMTLLRWMPWKKDVADEIIKLLQQPMDMAKEVEVDKAVQSTLLARGAAEVSASSKGNSLAETIAAIKPQLKLYKPTYDLENEVNQMKPPRSEDDVVVTSPPLDGTNGDSHVVPKQQDPPSQTLSCANDQQSLSEEKTSILAADSVAVVVDLSSCLTEVTGQSDGPNESSSSPPLAEAKAPDSLDSRTSLAPAVRATKKRPLMGGLGGLKLKTKTI